MRNSHIAVFIHYVWSTWDRLPLLTGEVERAVYRQIGDKCAALGAELVALGGVDDHVHLLVQAPATISFADFMNHVKGASSHLATHEVLAGKQFFKWQGSYAAFSVSPRHRDAVVNYIKRQREHHAGGTIIRAYEPDAWEPRGGGGATGGGKHT